MRAVAFFFLVPVDLLVTWLVFLFAGEADPTSLGSEGGLGPFCSKQEGELQCRSKRWLCGCASGSCENGGGIDREVLQNLNFTDGVVRMVTFKNELRVPKWLPSLLSPPVVWLLGGAVEMGTGGGKPSQFISVPTHTWSEIELPHSQCYLMLGGQTSTFRDRGVSAFRLVLHDTTFRFWEQERGKVSYDVLLTHGRLRLSDQHVRVLKRIIDHGDMQVARGLGSAASLARQEFDRDTDQDIDLRPIALELPPARFVFKDDAMVSMLSAYFGVFGLHRRLVEPLAKLSFNCVVMALLFGRSPRELLGLVPLAVHLETRAQARALNELWRQRCAPIFGQAQGLFQVMVERPPRPLPWWRSWWLQRLLPSPAADRVALRLAEQLDRFRPSYLSQVMLPLKNVLAQYDPELGKDWAEKFALTDKLLEYNLDEFNGLKEATADGCSAEHVVDQLLFCPDWQRTNYWQKARSGRKPELHTATLVKETNIAVRRLLYWHAAKRISSEPEHPHEPMARSCLSRGGVQACFVDLGE